MRKSFLSRYRVDNVPIFLRPIFYIYGYGLGALLFLVLLILRITIKIEITGRDNLKEYPNHIFCTWHSFFPLGLLGATPDIPAVLGRSSHAWMQHPTWCMKPIHVLLRLIGVEKVILGSTGHSGRDAAEQLIEFLRKGYLTVLTPDGPDGPASVLKKGILHVSMQTQVPIVAMRLNASRFFELKTWDRKKLPCPFSTIELKIGNPIQINSDNFNEGHSIVTQELG